MIDQTQAQNDIAVRNAAVSGDIQLLVRLWGKLENPRILVFPQKLPSNIYSTIVQLIFTSPKFLQNHWHQTILGYIYADALIRDIREIINYFSNFVVTHDFYYGYCLYNGITSIDSLDIAVNIGCPLAINEDVVDLAIEYIQPQYLTGIPVNSSFPDVEINLLTLISFDKLDQIRQAWGLVREKFSPSLTRERYLNFLAVFLNMNVELTYNQDTIVHQRGV